MEHAHKIYTLVKDTKEADAVAKAVVDKVPTMVDQPFVFPALKPDEVRAKITHTGLCNHDVIVAKSGEAAYPIVLGHEVIGEITHLGSEVKKFKVGDRVGFGPDAKNLHEPTFGGYATSIQAPALTCFHIPEKLPSDRCPPLLCHGLNVWAPLIDKGSKGCKLGVMGIGGSGNFAIKFGKALGYHVTAFTGKPKERGEEIKKLGADEVGSSNDIAELKTLASTFDLIIIGFNVKEKEEELLNAYIHLLKASGTFCLAVSGKKGAFDVKSIVQSKKLNYYETKPGNIKETEDMLKIAAEHSILPECEIYDWEDFSTAFKKCETGDVKDYAVVNVGKYAAKCQFKH